DERLLELGESAGVARAPPRVIRERVAAPQQAARTIALVPLACSGSQLLVEPRALDVFVSPLDEARPRRQQRLVDDLDGLVTALVLRADEQPRGDQLLDDRVAVGAEQL